MASKKVLHLEHVGQNSGNLTSTPGHSRPGWYLVAPKPEGESTWWSNLHWDRGLCRKVPEIWIKIPWGFWNPKAIKKTYESSKFIVFLLKGRLKVWTFLLAICWFIWSICINIWSICWWTGAGEICMFTSQNWELNCQAIVHTPAWSRTRRMDVQGGFAPSRCARCLAQGFVEDSSATNVSRGQIEMETGRWYWVWFMFLFHSWVWCWITSGRC